MTNLLCKCVTIIANHFHGNRMIGLYAAASTELLVHVRECIVFGTRGAGTLAVGEALNGIGIHTCSMSLHRELENLLRMRLGQRNG